jgi:hypothetical protein
MNLKNILPFENYTLTTKLPVQEVVKRLSENVETKKKTFFSFTARNTTKPYEGRILSDIFTINRVINYRNSFLPVITGHITSFPGQTQINIKMRLATFVLIFISFWLGVVALVYIGTLIAAVVQLQGILRHGFSPMVLIPFAMLLFGSLLTIFAFKGESKNSKDFLAELLEGQETGVEDI